MKMKYFNNIQNINKSRIFDIPNLIDRVFVIIINPWYIFICIRSYVVRDWCWNNYCLNCWLRHSHAHRQCCNPAFPNCNLSFYYITCSNLSFIESSHPVSLQEEGLLNKVKGLTTVPHNNKPSNLLFSIIWCEF